MIIFFKFVGWVVQKFFLKTLSSIFYSSFFFTTIFINRFLAHEYRGTSSLGGDVVPHNWTSSTHRNTVNTDKDMSVNISVYQQVSIHLHNEYMYFCIILTCNLLVKFSIYDTITFFKDTIQHNHWVVCT